MALHSTAARRYAEAAFQLAQRDGTEDAWRVALRAAGAALGDASVLRVMDNPALPYPDRLAAVREILAEEPLEAIVRAVAERDPSIAAIADAALGPIRDAVGAQLIQLVSLLVERRRVSQLPTILAEYERLLDNARGVVRALVTSATPLDDDEINAVRAKIASMTDRDVALTMAVDPGLIGGITVRIGDRIFDSSIRGRLERLRSRLVEGGRQLHGTGA